MASNIYICRLVTRPDSIYMSARHATCTQLGIYSAYAQVIVLRLINMSQPLVLLVAFLTILFGSCRAQENLGPGIWSVISISPCPKDYVDEEKTVVDVNKHKLNRTHDGLSGSIDTQIDLDNKLGLYADVYKYVYGGCKPYQVVSEDDFVRFVENYTGDNAKILMRLAKIDPPEFPVPVGNHSFENFIVDYCQLPRNCLYGKFKAYVYLLEKDKKVACVEVIAQFTEFPEENYCD